MDLLFDIVVGFLLAYPGAFARWLVLLLFGKRKSFKEVFESDVFLNSIIGSLVLVIIGVAIFAIYTMLLTS